jgi:hypothetical protein
LSAPARDHPSIRRSPKRSSTGRVPDMTDGDCKSAARRGDRPRAAAFACIREKMRDQISRKTQRRIAERRFCTLSQLGSISQRVAATEESSELPSWGVKQKP